VPKVSFLNEVVAVEVPAGTTLRDVAIQQGIALYRGMWTHINCIGNGLCGRCKIWIVGEGNASRPSLRERAHRSVRGRARLACQVRVVGDIAVRTRPLGSATVAVPADSAAPSYLAAAERRLAEAREEAKKEPEKKAKAAKPVDAKPAIDGKPAKEEIPATPAEPAATDQPPPAKDP
jgi:ferredoxin